MIFVDSLVTAYRNQVNNDANFATFSKLAIFS